MNSGSVRQLRAQLRESVRVAILEAAEALIAANGLQGAALAQIAKRAGVAVGTLYNYFDDRDDLVRGLFEMRRATLRPQLLAAVAAGADEDFEPRLVAFMREVLAVFEAHRKFIKVAIETEHVRHAPSTTMADLSTAIGELVTAGVREGVLAKDRAPMLGLVVAGGIRALVVRRIADGDPLAPRDADLLVKLLLDGARR